VLSPDKGPDGAKLSIISKKFSLKIDCFLKKHFFAQKSVNFEPVIRFE
jgi:hypothetical protein